MIELLTFGLGFWLFSFLLTFFIFGIILSEAKSTGLTLAFYLVAYIIADFVFNLGLLNLIIVNPFFVILLIIGYVAFGALYTALWRWPNYIKDNGESIKLNFNSWSKAVTRGTHNFDEFLKSSYYQYSASKNKDILINWVLMWVFSLTWQLIERPVKLLRKFIWVTLGEIFQNISEREAKKINKG